MDFLKKALLAKAPKTYKWCLNSSKERKYYKSACDKINRIVLGTNT
jgi:hypothetical protein